MTTELPAVLAIDGGNSKTDVALVAADGSLLASARGPGVRTFPTPAVLGAIGTAISLAASDAGLAGRFPVADHTVACMANADLPEEELVARAKGSPKVQAQLNGGEIRQTIVVPRKLVNLVTK